MIDDFTEYTFDLGKLSGISVFVRLNERIKDDEEIVNLNNLCPETKQKIAELKSEIDHHHTGLNAWSTPAPPQKIEISLNEYYSLIYQKERKEQQRKAIEKKGITKGKFLSYLLQDLTAKQLVSPCLIRQYHRNEKHDHDQHDFQGQRTGRCIICRQIELGIDAGGKQVGKQTDDTEKRA